VVHNAPATREGSTSTLDYTYEVPTNSLLPGKYIVNIVARDTNGNTASKSMNITLLPEHTIPTAELLISSVAIVNATHVSFRYTVNDTINDVEQVIITANGQNPVHSTIKILEATLVAQATITIPANLSGDLVVNITLTDISGNTASYLFTISPTLLTSSSDPFTELASLISTGHPVSPIRVKFTTLFWVFIIGCLVLLEALRRDLKKRS